MSVVPLGDIMTITMVQWYAVVEYSATIKMGHLFNIKLSRIGTVIILYIEFIMTVLFYGDEHDNYYANYPLDY